MLYESFILSCRVYIPLHMTFLKNFHSGLSDTDKWQKW